MELVPSGAYFDVSSQASSMSDADAVKRYEGEMKEWKQSADAEAATTIRQNREYEKVAEYIRYLEGDHWGKKRPPYRSRFVANRLGRIREEHLALLTDIRPTISVASKVEAYVKQAEIAHRVIEYEWMHNDLDLSLVSVVDQAMFGAGYWKIGAAMPGLMRFVPCGMDVVIPIQPGLDIQDSAAVLYRTYKPLWYFQNLFPKKFAEIAASRPGDGNPGSIYLTRPNNIDEYTWNALSPQLKYKLGTRSSGPYGMDGSGGKFFRGALLQEYWVNDTSINNTGKPMLMKDPNLSLSQHNYWYEVPPGGRKYPRKRLIVYANDVLCYDGPAPFWHGLYPFPQLRLNPVIWAACGLSKYRNIVPLNNAINEIGAGVMDMIKQALNRQVVTKEGAITPSAWKDYFPDMPGGKLRLQGISNPATDVRFMDPPVLPAYVVSMLSQFLLPELEKMSGIIDISALGGKKQVPGGDTIEQMRDSMQGPVRLESRYVEAFLRAAGVQCVSNIFQFYTMKQRLKIVGEDGITAQDFDYDPESMVPDNAAPKEDHWRNFSMMIGHGSLHGASRDRERQMAVVLYKLRAISRADLLRRLNWGDTEKINQELAQEAATQLAAMNAAKASQGPPEGAPPGETPRMTRGARNGEQW